VANEIADLDRVVSRLHALEQQALSLASQRLCEEYQ
jgi:hypothetical protein